MQKRSLFENELLLANKTFSTTKKKQNLEIMHPSVINADTAEILISMLTETCSSSESESDNGKTKTKARAKVPYFL